MIIQILSACGCSACKTLYASVQQAVKESGIDASVIKVEDMMEIIGYNVMTLPALVVNQRVVSTGKSLSVKDIIAILEKEKTNHK